MDKPQPSQDYDLGPNARTVMVILIGLTFPGPESHTYNFCSVLPQKLLIAESCLDWAEWRVLGSFNSVFRLESRSQCKVKLLPRTGQICRITSRRQGP